MWFNCLRDTEPLKGDRFAGVPGTHFINLERMRTESTWEPLTGFKFRNPYWESNTLNTWLLLQLQIQRF